MSTCTLPETVSINCVYAWCVCACVVCVCVSVHGVCVCMCGVCMCVCEWCVCVSVHDVCVCVRACVWCVYFSACICCEPCYFTCSIAVGGFGLAIVYMVCTTDEGLRRNAERGLPVPQDTVKRMHESAEPPNPKGNWWEANSIVLDSRSGVYSKLDLLV